ncbi:hypothetical protein A0J61_05876 [Choanephora cucurbitarum]|uniref:Uncharacterized protein n=1 Tax=Choanephora cucurbitarum TaxID=101091 RepID=A0A1C7NFF3_9FUNG|nr:hypothetical protein A0J61_05876 [Choanephora cucurbitarum]
MPPEKKQKVLVSDLDWCIKHSNILSIQMFSETFNYGDKSSANQRYSQIIRSKRFNACVSNAEEHLSALNRWKNSQQEATFWENRKLQLTRQSTELQMRTSAVGAIGRLGTQEANRLAKDNSSRPEMLSDDVPFPINSPTNTNVDEMPATTINLAGLKSSYQKMNRDMMWQLQCSGRKVEEVLYMFGLTLKYEHLCHSFVLDPWDNTYQQASVFTKEELNEIKSFKIKDLPSIPAKTLNYLNLYKQAKTTAEVRQMLLLKQSWDENFDRKASHDLDWIRHSYYTLLVKMPSNIYSYALKEKGKNRARELERGNLDSADNSETWLLAHIWTIVDRVFDDIEVDVVRGESASLASSIRKNKNRVPKGREKLERKKMGRRLDMILRKKNMEVGGGEAGKEKADNDAKLLRERDLKLPKALKDMFMYLKNEDIELAGILQYGLTMSMIRMDVPVHYVHRIRRTQVVKVPSDPKNLSGFRKVLFMALTAKALVNQTLSILQSESNDSDDNLTSVMNPPTDHYNELPVTFDSP